LEDFVYEPDGVATFEMWYKRFETVFTKDAEKLKLSEEDKVKLLVRRLHSVVFARINSSIALKAPFKLKFEELKDRWFSNG
jgi:hypothetical protein